MQDVNCKKCGKLLAKANTMNAAIKCPRCNMVFEYKVLSNLQTYTNNDIMPTEPQEGRYESSK